jgi:hypothetical protein
MSYMNSIVLCSAPREEFEERVVMARRLATM